MYQAIKNASRRLTLLNKFQFVRIITQPLLLKTNRYCSARIASINSLLLPIPWASQSLRAKWICLSWMGSLKSTTLWLVRSKPNSNSRSSSSRHAAGARYLYANGNRWWIDWNCCFVNNAKNANGQDQLPHHIAITASARTTLNQSFRLSSFTLIHATKENSILNLL